MNMNMWDFLNKHCVLDFFLILSLYETIVLTTKLINNSIRHRNIIKCGWPPTHLDADGDFSQVAKDE